MWKRTVAAVALLLAAAGAASGQTGNEEAICRNDPNVIFCENYEDRAVGGSDLGGSRFKNNGWAVSDFPSFSVVQTAEKFDGTRGIAMITFANTSGGTFMDTVFPDGVPRRTIYYRWYTKYSSNYVWSPEATKHNETLGLDPAVGPGAEYGVFNFVGAFGTPRQPLFTRAYSVGCLASPPILTECNDRPNMNGGFAQFNVNQWYCLEARITQNTGATANDGYFQGWIDGVQYWEYPNINMQSQHQANPKHFGILITPYWNCVPGGPLGTDCSQSPHPQITRYMDNIIVSDARIGCLGAIPPTPPPTTPCCLTVASLADLWWFGAPFLAGFVRWRSRRWFV